MTLVSTATPVAAAVPATTPTITAPVNDAVVLGTVVISAESTATSVQFYVDQALYGVPVAVVSGAASTPWPTWGIQNGAHTLAAADCNEEGCNATWSETVTVTVQNAKPKVTAPASNAVVPPTFTMKATSPGGGIAFFLDGTQQGFDDTSPYELALADLAEGAHSAYIQQCDTSGTSCEGPTSSTVQFTVKVLHPKITKVSPNPFSPNGDGRNDKTTFTIQLAESQSVRYSIRDADENQLVYKTLGTLSAGSHSYKWGGHRSSGALAPDGTYTIRVATSKTASGGTLTGKTSATVRVDTKPPSLSSMTGSGATFYPYNDGYRDRFSPSITVSTGGNLWLRIYTTGGTTIRSILLQHSGSGTFKISWDGRNSSGTMVTGTFNFAFVGEDKAGNRKKTGLGIVYSSGKRLVGKATTVTRNGDDAYSIASTDPGCTDYYYSLSHFAYGLWLLNVCNYSDEVIFAKYSFTVPSAVRYDSLKVSTYGGTINPGECIGALTYDYSRGEWEAVSVIDIFGYDEHKWSNFGSISASGNVSNRVIKVSIGVTNYCGISDYDIGKVRIVVNYAVLQ